MRTPAIFGAKNFGLFEIYGVSALRTDKLPAHCASTNETSNSLINALA